MLYAGHDVGSLLVLPGPDVDCQHEMCRRYDMPDFMLRVPAPMDHSPEEEHARRASIWAMQADVDDVRSYLLERCKTDVERMRVNDEMDMFDERGMIPVLRLMIALVDHIKERGLVRGVGRGSSVASYCLYLIGVHKIDSIKYGLNIREFLK